MHTKHTSKPTAAWMSAKEPSFAGGGSSPRLRPTRASCIARIDTPRLLSRIGLVCCGVVCLLV